MMFRDGFFHADAHPGNVMLLDDGRACLLDWGQCAELDDRGRLALCRLVLLLHSRDAELIAAAVDAPSSGFRFDAAICLLYTSPSPRDQRGSRMPSSA